MLNQQRPQKVRVFEVGLRDGLQSEDKILSVDERVSLGCSLVEAGLKDIEVGSFVRADRIPQLAHTEEVIQQLEKKLGSKRASVRFWAFIPNQKGLDAGVQAGIQGASFFYATSDTFCRKNVNRSRVELLTELQNLIPQVPKNNLRSRVYLSTLVFCPYEGQIPIQKTLESIEELLNSGVQEVVLSDTTGHLNPQKARELAASISKQWGVESFAWHLHDTRALALSNVWEALNCGFKVFDASVGGMGGCPYAPGAAGNLATEDLVNLLIELGIECEVDLKKLAAAGIFAEKCLHKELPSKVLKTIKGISHVSTS